MMEAARAALGVPGPGVPLLIAVTVLTSLTQEELAETGVPEALESQVLRLARLAGEAGLDGVVCSSREAPLLRAALGAAPVLVTPGIRAADAPADDQRRTLTPRQAVDAGSDFLVIGRPITGAGDPRAALENITSEISYRSPPAGVLA
jgi:orotidine-5'-phosphate decarboxylase